MVDSYSTTSDRGATVSLDTALAYLTGLRWIDPHLDSATLVRTALVVHTCDAVLCRLFAHNNGYSKNLWTALGFCFASGRWRCCSSCRNARRRRSGRVGSTHPPSATACADACPAVCVSDRCQRVAPIARARACAPPCSTTVGRPELRTTSMSRHHTPFA